MEDLDYAKDHRRARRSAAIDRSELNEWRPRSTIFADRRKNEERKQCRKKVRLDSLEE